MALLARLNDFTAGTPIVSGDVDNEFNQIINALSGGVTNKNLLVRFSDAATAPLKLDQLGAGLIQEWAAAGVSVASVTNAGAFSTTRQFISTLAIGTKPIDVTSTTVCTNLNADQVDGIEGAAFLRSDAADTMSASDGTSLLDINQTGAGAITRFRLSGADKVVIANGGQIQSSVSTGTAPFTIASTTVVANLNADLLDGLSSAVFVRNDNGAQGVAGDFTITDSSPKLIFTDSDGADFEFEVNIDTMVLRSIGVADIFNVAHATQVMTFGAIPVLPASDPTTANQAVRKAYADSLLTGVMRNLVSDTTTNTSSSGDLTSFTVPAGTLPTNGDYILFHMGGETMDDNAVLTITFNGNTIFSFDNNVATADAGDWGAEAIIIRSSDTAVNCKVTFQRQVVGGVTPASAQDVAYTQVAAASLAGSTNVFKCAATSDSITQNFLIGEYVQR